MKAYEEKMIGKNPEFNAKWYFVTGSKILYMKWP